MHEYTSPQYLDDSLPLCVKYVNEYFTAKNKNNSIITSEYEALVTNNMRINTVSGIS
jgi:hypothetical protein